MTPSGIRQIKNELDFTNNTSSKKVKKKTVEIHTE